MQRSLGTRLVAKSNVKPLPDAGADCRGLSLHSPHLTHPVARAVGGAPPGMRIDPQSVHDAQLRDFYLALSRAWGPQHWWPARSRFEVIAGAFLTQNTSWTNVERALGQLRHA